MYSLVLLVFLRIFVLEFINIIHSYCLPICLLLLFWFFNEQNKKRTDLNFYLLSILVPGVVLIVAQKTIAQSPEVYHLNESFISWMILLYFFSFISPIPWYKVSIISALSFLIFYIRILNHFGVEKVRNDLYIHFFVTVVILSIIVRQKEALDR